MQMRYALMIPVVIVVADCGSQRQLQQRAGFTADYAQGNYSLAADEAIKQGAIAPDGHSSDLVWSLNAGAALFEAGDYGRSVKILDNGEALMKSADLQNPASSSATTVAAIAVNDTVRDYQFTTYDGVMINTYKALAFLSIGDKDSARIEFNRADDRQRRAADQFANEITKTQQALTQQQQKDHSVNYDSTITAAAKIPNVQQRMKDLSDWAAYRPFVNPFATYINGLFFVAQGGPDAEKGRQALERVRGMVSSNPVLDADYAMAQQIAAGGTPPKMVWVIFENGQSATFKEFRVDVPVALIAPNAPVAYTGIALPEFQANASAYRALHITSERGVDTRTVPLASMDAVIASEFKQRYPGILTRAVISAVLKTAGQYTATKAVEQNGGGELGGQLTKLVGAAFQAATTAADLRSWTALPKEFQIARFDATDAGKVTIRNETGATLGEVDVPNDKSCIIYVKIQHAGGQPAIKVIPLR